MWNRKQAGTSLLEVLIAILVMSIGLVAMGLLAASAQRYIKMAQFESASMRLASELGERMRGNTSAVELGLYGKTAMYSATSTISIPDCAVDGACTAAEIAAIDIAQWNLALRQRLPGGDGFVRRDADNTLATDMWVMWLAPDAPVGGTSDMSVARTGECPAAALKGLPTTSPPPRCLYFRISL